MEWLKHQQQDSSIMTIAAPNLRAQSTLYCNNFKRFRFAGILMSEFAVSLLVELAVFNKATDEGLSGHNWAKSFGKFAQKQFTIEVQS